VCAPRQMLAYSAIHCGPAGAIAAASCTERQVREVRALGAGNTAPAVRGLCAPAATVTAARGATGSGTAVRPRVISLGLQVGTEFTAQ
jgi:stage V sporulation protein SpoVS